MNTAHFFKLLPQPYGVEINPSPFLDESTSSERLSEELQATHLSGAIGRFSDSAVAEYEAATVLGPRLILTVPSSRM